MMKEAENFEDLIFELLNMMNFNDLERQNTYRWSKNHHIQPDISFTDKDLLKTAVEIKLYNPLLSPPTKAIDLAIFQLKRIIEEKTAQKGILIASCPVNLKNHHIYNNISIWDLETILEKAKVFPTIYNKIINILELELEALPLPLEVIEEEVEKTRQLVFQHRNILPGKAHAYRFESWCIETLQHLFKEDLHGWHVQCETVDGLQRRDLVCRIIKTDIEIWSFLSNSLQSKYITFEFKNHTNQISQREIFTTERYLYPKAFRSCAVIISREGCNESAIRVIEGAMRDQGKLIISLTSQELCDMLTLKENGDDLNVYLFERLDNFLMKLGR